MRGVVLHGAGDARVQQRPDPRIEDPKDAVIRIEAACVCGSDLWPYRGDDPGEDLPMGHEYVGVVEQVGDEVSTLTPGDWVVGSFVISDNTCEICRAGYQSRCVHAVFVHGEIGTQAERARIPWADGTLVRLPGEPDEDLIPSLLAASDVLGTGWFAADAAQAGPGKTVAVVGDDGVARIKELTDGLGAHSVIEAVGNQGSMMQAIRSTRPGGHVGYVGVSHDVQLPGDELFFGLIHLHGGPAPVRRFLPDLIRRIWDREIDPGKVFDRVLPLEEAAEAYRLMDQREAVKVMLRP